VADPLRALWDFDDLDATERRFRDRLAAAPPGPERSELLTQLARVEGLRGRFDDGEALLDEATKAAGDSALANARIDLERGRLRRSGADSAAALPLFETALDGALDAEAWFVAADAAHMAALAAPTREARVEWTSRGIELAETHDGASYWLGPLLNNLGWEHHGAGDYHLALDAFERALAARERDPDNRAAIEIARYAVGKTLRALGRIDDAIPLLERAVAWAESEGKPDGWFHEELAVEYTAVGRTEDARCQAQLAVPLLEAADPTFAADAERSARLRSLAGAGPTRS
jgi:tetratricopeptide (TPR) repeat protein